ncbi:hypothetical protein [Butyrivibrio sp. JL13D10]
MGKWLESAGKQAKKKNGNNLKICYHVYGKRRKLEVFNPRGIYAKYQM